MSLLSLVPHLQYNGLFLHEDRYFGNHSGMASVMKGVLPLHRMHVQEIQLACHIVWKLTMNEHICFKSHVLRTNSISC